MGEVGGRPCRPVVSTRYTRRWLVIVVALLAVSCAGEEAALVPVASPTSGASPTTTPAAEPSSSPVPTVTATPSPSPTATPRPRRLCVEDLDRYEQRLRDLEVAVTGALTGYRGTWGFALIDIDCNATATVHPDHVQYAASTGKLPFIIAALRAVQDGRLDFDDLEQDFEAVLRFSYDINADNIVAAVTRDEVSEVLRIAGVSEATYWGESWSDFFSTATDLSLVWAALLRGELLDEQWTEYLLDLATQADVPEIFETFTANFDRPGLEFGQKAGYATEFGPPYYLVGSGFLRPETGSSAGFAVTLLLLTDANLSDEQRRLVFPLVLDFVEEAISEVE